jgi:alginate O-acetyltransferase complex protein AlgI
MSGASWISSRRNSQPGTDFAGSFAMAFHSFLFIFIFFPIVVVGYALWGRLSVDAAKVWLITSSVVFYAWSGPRALPFLVLSILLNYWVSGRIATAADSGKYLKLALVANIAALGVFKYSAFASNNIRTIFGGHWSVPELVLPLGISFFTVQQIMFLVDRHQGVAPRPRFLDYALFVSWFPYIVAGPITRWRDVIPQFPVGKASLHDDNLARGTILFILGLVKKVILSSSFSNWADIGFEHPNGVGLMGAWLATSAFGLQLYFDFSGYTDMARGVALIFNVNLPENFNNPFWSRSIAEYWQRWHMSLTAFITNYIYTPILRAKRPTFRRAIYATVVTMTIAGIWHGAAWVYALFGLSHGIGLAVNTAWRKYKRTMPEALAFCTTAAFVLVGFAFFRARTVGDAWTLIHSMFLPAHLAGPTLTAMTADREPARLFSSVVGVVLLFWPATASQFANQINLRPRLAFALALCLFLCLMSMNSTPVTGFIYRQF